MDPFIHLLGSSLIQWMIARINGRDKIKQDLPIRLGKAMLRLGGEVCLGGSNNQKFRPRVRLGKHSFTKAKGCRANNINGVFSPLFTGNIPSKPKLKQINLQN